MLLKWIIMNTVTESDAQIWCPQCHLVAGVAELADAPDLGSGVARRGSSSLFVRTSMRE